MKKTEVCGYKNKNEIYRAIINSVKPSKELIF